MESEHLYNVAKRYVAVIEKMERTHDAAKLPKLEEERAYWHDKLLQLFRREGISYRDREHVTRLAYKIIREFE